jgi:hypothetical protein
MAKKRKYVVPVAIEWDIEVEAENKNEAIRIAWERMEVGAKFGANEGRSFVVHGSKAKVKR